MYYVVYGLFWLISLIPLRVLYFFSDAIYGLVFYILKYRRKIVMSNLLIAFPEKTEKERKVIAKKFYHNLIDMFIETLKMVSASDEFIKRRITGNFELVDKLYPSGKSVQIHIGHNFNWEWGNLVAARSTRYKLLAVYMPLTNKAMDRLFLKLRSRSGSVMLRATRMREDFSQHANTQYVIALAADQSPGHPANAWWVDFFGKLTPFVKGPAKAALANNTEVVFAFIHKPRRGHYEVVFSLFKNTQQFTEQELTREFVTYLEAVVREYPEMWLWSHRRWKHEWKPEFQESTL